MPEKRVGAENLQIEEAKSRLEEFLSEARAGTPPAMALWDRLDLIDAVTEVAMWPNHPFRLQMQAAVESRISARCSEIPGYFGAYEKLEGLIDELENAFGVSASDHTSTQAAGLRRYLRNLREAVVQRE